MVLSRRTFIRVGLGAVVVVTGCSSDDGSEDPGAEPDRSSTTGHPPSHGTASTGSTATTESTQPPTDEPEEQPPAPTGTGQRWSDPATWGGTLPDESTDVVVDRDILLDIDATVASVEIRPDCRLEYAVATPLTLASRGNVVVEGELVAQPVAGVQHRLQFVGFDESEFAGGGMDPLDTDVGLWVMGNGVVALRGAEKTGWTRLADSVDGGRTLTLDAAPTGWAAGDQLVVAPTAVDDFAPIEVEIATVSGATVTTTAPVGAHPSVSLGDGTVATAEVLNLTRSVVIEGEPDRRAHVFIRSARRQHVSFVELRHLGPQVSDERDEEGDLADDGVTGRYALHFHHCEDGSRGSVVEGVVAHHLGNRAFVPHVSHGVTFHDCVAHDIRNEAYWWDPGEVTDGTVWEHCAASLVKETPENKHAMSAFFFGKGAPLTNIARDCTAFAVGGSESGAYFWNNPPTDGVWVFQDCVAHNNPGGIGVRVWQNTEDDHHIERFVGYRNPISGIKHGAYGNHYQYTDCRLVENGIGVELLAQSQGPGRQEWRGLYVDAGGGDYAVDLADGAPVGATNATLFEDCQFVNYREAALHVHPHSDEFTSRWEVVATAFDGNEVWFDDDVQEGTTLTIDGVVVETAGARPESRPAWNASV